MLSHEERIAEVKRRTAEKERQKRLRRRWIAAVSGVAACLAVIVGVSLSMPGIVERIEPGTFSGFETAATMLGGSAALGYTRSISRSCSRKDAAWRTCAHSW